MKDYQYLQQKFVVNTYPNRGVTFIKGRDVYLYDSLGKKYLDMMSNYGVSIFGYNNSKINNAIITQIKQLATLHGSFNNDIRAEASQKLLEYCGTSYHQVYWSNSGAEAIEAALKFAILATGKKKFIVCSHAYHGKTFGALTATDGDKYRQPFQPLLWNFVRIPYNDIDALEKAVDSDVVAFILEPIQGEGGIIPPAKGYLRKVEKICKKNDILLILDEIQSGTGRTGYFLASQEENVSGDIVCLGKGLGGGIPIGATVINEFVAKKIPRNIHTSTFGGNPLACSGVLATLKSLDHKQLGYVKKISAYFIKKLKAIKSPLIKEVRGKGLMIGIEILNNRRGEILKKLQDNHILTIPAGDTVVRFLPPYIIEKKHIDYVVKVLKKIL